MEIYISYTCGGIVQRDHVCELILLLHQVQLLRYGRVILEPVLAHLEHHLQNMVTILTLGDYLQYYKSRKYRYWLIYMIRICYPSGTVPVQYRYCEKSFTCN